MKDFYLFVPEPALVAQTNFSNIYLSKNIKSKIVKSNFGYGSQDRNSPFIRVIRILGIVGIFRRFFQYLYNILMRYDFDIKAVENELNEESVLIFPEIFQTWNYQYTKYIKQLQQKIGFKIVFHNNDPIYIASGLKYKRTLAGLGLRNLKMLDVQLYFDSSIENAQMYNIEFYPVYSLFIKDRIQKILDYIPPEDSQWYKVYQYIQKNNGKIQLGTILGATHERFQFILTLFSKLSDNTKQIIGLAPFEKIDDYPELKVEFAQIAQKLDNDFPAITFTDNNVPHWYQSTVLEIVSDVIIDIPRTTVDNVSNRYALALELNKKYITSNEKITDYPFYDAKYIKVIRSADDIDDEIIAWINDDTLVDYKYNYELGINHFCLEVGKMINNGVRTRPIWFDDNNYTNPKFHFTIKNRIERYLKGDIYL